MKASRREDFMESFIILNIINFVDVTKRKNGVSWDVKGISSP